MADYEWVTDTINLRPSYPSVKEFLITTLHEIRHALDRKKMGVKKYEKAYVMAGEIAVQKGGDFHDDNYFEEIAETPISFNGTADTEMPSCCLHPFSASGNSFFHGTVGRTLGNSESKAESLRSQPTV